MTGVQTCALPIFIESGICKNISQETKTFLENKLKNDPNNIEALLLLVIIETNTPKSNPDANIRLLEQIINISKETEAIALIFFAYIRDFSYIDEDLLNRLNSLNTNNHEINSMIKYAISWFYAENTNYNNPILEEKHLKESIELYQGHAWNYVHLARLYNKQGRNAESEQLIQKAQANVKNEPENQDYDPTNLNDFLNELIKGTSSDNVKL